MPRPSAARAASAVAALIAACATAVRLPAQEAPPRRGATLAEVLAYALRRSPALAIARAAIDSARAERRIARALPNPSYVANPNTPYQYGVAVNLDVGPQRFYRTRASALGAEATRFDERDSVRQVTLSVRRAFYDLLLADTLLSLSEARREIVRQVLTADSARFRAGDIPERNVFRSEGELARADADVARAEVAVRNARLALQLLMGVDAPDTGFTVSGTLRYEPLEVRSDSALLALALRRRPDLAASDERVEQSLAQHRLAAASLVPVPQLSYVRQFTAPFESQHFYSFGLSLEVPILNFYGGQRARAAAGDDASRAARSRTVHQVRRDVIAALTDVRTQRALVERFEAGLLAKSEAAVEAARYAYERGATSLMDVLDAVRAQQDLRTDYYTALHDYWVSAFALSGAVGDDVFTGPAP